MLALYIHFVGDLCRDVRRTVECRILKVSIYVAFNILCILLFSWCLFWIFVSVDTCPNWTMSVHWSRERSSSAHTGTRNPFDIWTVHHQRQQSIKTNTLLLFLPSTCTKTVLFLLKHILNWNADFDFFSCKYMCMFVPPFRSVESTTILFDHMLLFNWLFHSLHSPRRHFTATGVSRTMLRYFHGGQW